MSLLLLLVTILQIYLVAPQDLKSIFHTPPKRNYDDFGILERANFDKDESETTPTNSPPNAYANAQISLRFGGEASKGQCACGDVCQCRERVPYLVPVLAPLPYCLCAPPPVVKPLPLPVVKPFPLPVVKPLPPPVVQPLPTPITTQKQVFYTPIETPSPRAKPSAITLNKHPPCATPLPSTGNVANETTCSRTTNNNHPKILTTIDMSDEPITTKPPPTEYCEKVERLKLFLRELGLVILAPDLKIVPVDKVPLNTNDARDLSDSLIPYYSPKQTPKLLMTYPIFNKPKNNVLVNGDCVQSGYSCSGGAACYSDPVKTVIYQKPTILTIVGPQRNPVSGDDVRYVPIIEPQRSLGNDVNCVIVPESPSAILPEVHSEDCCCNSCAKYRGELNEMSA